jgi:hypothetical protein
MRATLVTLPCLIVVAASALLAGAAPADARAKAKATAKPATAAQYERPRVVGPASSDAIEAWAVNASAQWPTPCKRILVVPHTPFLGREAAGTFEGRCLIYVTPLFYEADRTTRDQCQIIAHEIRHLRGEEHQATNPDDVMFSHEDGTIYAGEGWLHDGAVPGCR